MPRRGRSTTVGKIAKLCQDRRASEIRMLGESLRREQHAAFGDATQPPGGRESLVPR
jgi:hypothetical protein